MIPLGWGIVLFLIVEVPMLMLILASIFGHPRARTLTSIFIAMLFGLLLALIIGAYIFGLLLGLFMPV